MNELRDLEYYQAQVGAGWSELVKMAYTEIAGSGLIISQIKEKFGGLRIYLATYNCEIDDFLWEVEQASLKTCEGCGEAGELRPGGWIKTLCDKCSEKRSKTGD